MYDQNNDKGKQNWGDGGSHRNGHDGQVTEDKPKLRSSDLRSPHRSTLTGLVSDKTVNCFLSFEFATHTKLPSYSNSFSYRNS